MIKQHLFTTMSAMNLNPLKTQIAKTAEVIWLLAQGLLYIIWRFALLTILVLGLLWVFIAGPWFFSKLFHVMELGMGWIFEHLFTPFLH